MARARRLAGSTGRGLPRRYAVLAITAALLAAVAVGSARFAAAPPDPGAGSATMTTTGPTLTFAAVGDSITNANSAGFAKLVVGNDSWVSYAHAPGLEFTGGWARGGATTADMVRNALPVRADVLVIIAGTNDVAHSVPFATVSQNLVTIARTVGAGRVIVSAIPPRDANPAGTSAFNAELEPFVAAQGWTYVDAMAVVRHGDRFMPGMSKDGTHPNRRGARLIGAAIAAALVQPRSTAGAP